MDISSKLKMLRQEKGLTASDVAKRLDITRSAYSNYEQGIRQPDYDILVRLCKLFDVSADYILGLESEDGTKISIHNSFNNSNILFGTNTKSQK